MQSGKRWPKSSSRGKDNDIMVSDDKVRARRERFVQENKNSITSYGLVSRGEEKRLQTDPQLRLEFFSTIQREFIKHCASFTDKESLRREINAADGAGSPMAIQADKVVKDIDWVLMSLRKLREALLAIEPDEFSKKVFLYCLRLSTKIGEYQTYLPSIHFLLNRCQLILFPSEFEETISYLILHMSHFNNDNLKLFQLLYEKIPKSRLMKNIMTAWVNQDFLAWQKLRESLETNLGFYKLMSLGEKQILTGYLKDIGRSYFIFPKSLLEMQSGYLWSDLQSKYPTNWQYKDEDGDKITIRERTRKVK